MAAILTAAEIATLALAAVLAARVLAMPVVRREAAAHPAIAFAAVAAIVASAGVAAWAAAVSPLARHALAGLALVLLLAAWWRSRVDYGAGRRWPPGSLGLRASLAAIDDRDYYRDQAARHGPVFKMSQFGRPVACVVGLERAHRILVDHAEALAPAVLPFNRVLTRGVLRYMTGADHREEAPVFRAAFAKMELAGAEASLRASLRRELDALAAESARSPEGAYARPAFERWLVTAIVRVFDGLEADDPRTAAIARVLPTLGYLRSGGAAWRRALVDGVDTLAAIVREVDAERRAGSTRVAPGTALALIAASDARALDMPARVENFVMIARVATSDLTGLLDWVFRFLGDAPGWVDAVRTHGRTAGTPRPAPPVDPATAIVMETLRLEQSEFLYRRTTRPIDVEGRIVPAGWILRLCVNESHRDPAVFADPDRFDPSRFVDRAWTRLEYSPFGGHTHGCMGGPLSLFLGRLFVEELAIGYDWSVVRDGPIEHGTRHRDHWRPSSRRRVVLRPRRDDAAPAPRGDTLAASR